jgi:hypothetical protein
MNDPVLLTALRSKIITLAWLHQERLGVVTDDKKAVLINSNNGAVEKNFGFASLGTHANRIAFSPNGNRFIYAHAQHIYVIDLETQKAIHRVTIDTAQIDILCFDNSSNYIVVGTDQGRVFTWHCDPMQMLSRLTSFPEHTHKMMPPLRNYVSAIANYKHLVASSGYGDSVVISNLSTGVSPIRIYPGRSRVNVIVFLDESKVLIGNDEGKVVKLFIHENRPHRQVSASIGAIKHLLVLSDRTFALAASTHKDIALLNIETMEVIESHYLSFKQNITSIVLGSDMLVYVALESGEIFSVKLMPVELLKNRIENRQYELAYALIEEVPLLKQSSWFEDLEKIFSQHYAKAIRSLLLRDDPGAFHHLEAFIRTASKKKIIQELFYAFHHYPRLQFLLKKGRLSAAYGLVEEHRALRMTPEFQAIEKQWERYFEQAQKLIIQGKEAEAKKLLQAFNMVSSKAPLIRLVLEVSTDILIFSKAIASRDYKSLHLMSKRYPSLKLMPSYQSVIEEAEALIEAIMNALKEDQFEKAQASCELLLEVPHLKKHYEHISRFIQKAEHLFRAQTDNELRQCYATLDSFVELAILPRSKILESQWQERIQQCETAALAGDAKAILKRIKAVMPLPSRQEKLGSLLRLTYLLQLKGLAIEDKRFETGVMQYLKFFGNDNEMRTLLSTRNMIIKAETFSRDHWLEFYTALPDFIYEAI